MNEFRLYRILTVLALSLVALFVAIHAAQATYSAETAAVAAQQDDGPAAPEGNPAPSCRYGVAITDVSHVPSVDALGAGWYINFQIYAPPASNGAEFAHVITVKQQKNGATYLDGYNVSPALTDAALGARISNNPGALWIVGNEVDRGPDPGQTVSVQGDVYPGVYARAYHDVYHFIKQRDPNALVAVSALVQVTPGRIQYLNMVYDAYLSRYGQPMPVDVWNMHLYVLPEVLPNGQPNGIANIALGTDPALGISESYDPTGGNDPSRFKDSCPLSDVYCFAEHDSMDAFREQIVRMRQWMASHGYRNRPLLLSEYSLLLPYQYSPGNLFYDEYGNTFNPSRVQAFMSNTLDYLSTASDPNIGFPSDGNRLVQQWLWFSVYNLGVGEVSNLVQNPSTGALSNLGQLFRSRVEAEADTVNLYPSEVRSKYAHTNGAATVDVTLEAVVGNNGSQTAGSFVVTFYRDGALTNVIDSVTVPNLTGCGTRETTVSVTWPGVSPGLRNYWVEVDSAGAISEQNENDNVRRGTVFVDPEQLFLPSISGG